MFLCEGLKRFRKRLAAADLDLRAGEAVAAVTGTATLPGSAKAANAGDVKAVTFVRDGTVIYACKIPGGAVLIIR